MNRRTLLLGSVLLLRLATACAAVSSGPEPDSGSASPPVPPTDKDAAAGAEASAVDADAGDAPCYATSSPTSFSLDPRQTRVWIAPACSRLVDLTLRAADGGTAVVTVNETFACAGPGTCLIPLEGAPQAKVTNMTDLFVTGSLGFSL